MPDQTRADAFGAVFFPLVISGTEIPAATAHMHRTTCNNPAEYASAAGMYYVLLC